MFLSQTCPDLYSVLENQDEESSSSTKSVVAEKQTTVKKRKQQPGGETQPASKKKAGLKNCGPLNDYLAIRDKKRASYTDYPTRINNLKRSCEQPYRM